MILIDIVGSLATKEHLMKGFQSKSGLYPVAAFAVAWCAQVAEDQGRQPVECGA